ncbi:hypothetical protein BKA61DRAFT_571380 [Leptodontidium sp. MPI-SDFR-AT-0119]|nr:hypothetical protein BKA61DRAFT_571380 [Leptodontidium sp. MPI-SDFR-AT-0119]
MHDTPHPTPLAQHNSLHITLLSLGQSQPHHAYTIQRMPLARDDQSRIRARSRVGIVEALLSKKLVILCGNKSLPIEAFEVEKITTEYFHATDPRDKIYALLSLSPPLQTAHIIPDYSAPVADVYAAVTALCIIRYQDLTVLHFDADSKSDEHDLPSWVRDYSSSGLLGTRPTYVAFSLSEYAASGRDCWGRRKIFVDNLFSPHLRQLRSRGVVVDEAVYVGRNEPLDSYTGVDPVERPANVKERSARTLANVRAWEGRVGEIRRDGSECPYDGVGGRRVAFWRTLVADRWFEKWAPLPGDMLENVYFETWMGRLPLPGSVVEGCAPDEDMEEVKEVVCQAVYNACITRCHGRSFVITSKGYIGVAPLKTEIGDLVTVLEGGYLPFVLRRLEGGG